MNKLKKSKTFRDRLLYFLITLGVIGIVIFLIIIWDFLGEDKEPFWGLVAVLIMLGIVMIPSNTFK